MINSNNVFTVKNKKDPCETKNAELGCSKCKLPKAVSIMNDRMIVMTGLQGLKVLDHYTHKKI